VSSSRSTLPASFTDVRSNRNEQIEQAVALLRGSKNRLAVFKAVYHHKKQVKSVAEVAKLSGLDEKVVLTAGLALVQRHLIGQLKQGKRVQYIQDRFFQAEKRKILRHVENPRGLSGLPTKRNPRVQVTVTDRRTSAKRSGRSEFLTVDTIDSFAAVRPVPPPRTSKPLSEEQFKMGIQRILVESGVFKDWGGEQSDVFTTQLVVGGRRRRAAFAFKGPGKRIKKLRPKDMGKNGDQIARLFKSAADVFIVQFHGEIHEDTIALMETYAMRRASESRATVFFGVINGQDSNRLVAAYPEAFKSRPASSTRFAKRNRSAA